MEDDAFAAGRQATTTGGSVPAAVGRAGPGSAAVLQFAGAAPRLHSHVSQLHAVGVSLGQVQEQDVIQGHGHRPERRTQQRWLCLEASRIVIVAKAALSYVLCCAALMAGCSGTTWRTARWHQSRRVPFIRHIDAHSASTCLDNVMCKETRDRALRAAETAPPPDYEVTGRIGSAVPKVESFRPTRPLLSGDAPRSHGGDPEAAGPPIDWGSYSFLNIKRYRQYFNVDTWVWRLAPL